MDQAFYVWDFKMIAMASGKEGAIRDSLCASEQE